MRARAVVAEVAFLALLGATLAVPVLVHGRVAAESGSSSSGSLSSADHVGGDATTGWDLVFDLAGCTAAAVFLVRSGARRTGEEPAPHAPGLASCVGLPADNGVAGA